MYTGSGNTINTNATTEVPAAAGVHTAATAAAGVHTTAATPTTPPQLIPPPPPSHQRQGGFVFKHPFYCNYIGPHILWQDTFL